MSDKMCDRGPGPGFDLTGLLADSGGECVVDRALSLLAAARGKSCGRCVFCREGTIQLHEILRDATRGKAESGDLELLGELAAMLRDYSGCEMAAKAADSLLCLMARYPEEFEEHFRRKRCSALRCKAYYTIHVLPEKCLGCGACVSLCPEGAIAGGVGLIHVIAVEKCTRCGLCIEECQSVSRAIVKAGALRPRLPESPQPVGSWGEEGRGRRRRRGNLDDGEGKGE